MTRLTLIIIYLFLFCGLIYGQNLTKIDSTELLSTGNKISKYILSNDTSSLRILCVDSIECTLCGFRNDTVIDYVKPISYFFKNGISHLKGIEKLWNSLASSKPDIIEGYIGTKFSEERTYGIAYILYYPNELGKKHEGVQAVFDYVLRDGKFKLISITTIP